MITFSRTIAASDTYDLLPTVARLHDVEITNQGPGLVYFGVIPVTAITITCWAETGESKLTAFGTGADLIMEGMTVTNSNSILGASPVVQSINGSIINLQVANIDQANTTTGADFTFTPPAISSTNGHPLQVGETMRLSASEENCRGQKGRRFVADASGAVLTFSKYKA